MAVGGVLRQAEIQPVGLVARALQQAAHRPRDCLARYGGEEFVLLLPGADASSARAVAQRCMQEVAHAGIVHAASPLGQQLTVSVGMGTALPGTQDDSKRFLETVDRCLYRAKHAGRNRIEATA